MQIKIISFSRLFLVVLLTTALSAAGWSVHFSKARAASSSAVMDGITPVRLVIPDINLDTTIEPVSVLPNGQMDVPKAFDRVGILTPGTKPGQPGNSVIAGHFDHYTGPAVFYKLKRLQPGNQVYVLDKEEHIRAFTVTSVEPFKPKEAPIDKIFGGSEKAHLNLITCHGTYSRKTKDHSHRLVVFTELNKEQDLS